MFKDYGLAIGATLTSTREGDSYTLSQTSSALESIERALDKAVAEIDEVRQALVAFRQADGEATRQQAVTALSAVRGLASSARASGTLQSEVAGVTAKAGFIQGLIETNLITEKEA